MNLWHRRVAALMLGCGMQFAFSPYDHVWFAILAFTGLVWLSRGEDSFKIGLFFGFGWFGFGSWWLADTFHVYGDVPYPVALAVIAFIGLVLGLFVALWSWLSWKIAGKSLWILLIFPAVGVCIEWLRGHLFTGLPWMTTGNLLLDTSAIGWASIVGVYGITFLLICFTTSLALLTEKKHRYWAMACMVVTVCLGWFAPSPVTAEGEVYRVALIQGNIPQDQKWDRNFLNETMQRYRQLSEKSANQVDLIVWPEAAIPFFLEDALEWDQWLSQQVQKWNKPLLFGGLQWISSKAQDRTAQTGLFLTDPTTLQRTFAGKHHLVPFGEYVPSWIPFLHKLIPNIASFRPATDAGVLRYGNQVFGSLICYESIFPEEARHRVSQGANVIALVTNDAWYDKSPAAWQHLQAARMRAVETGRYVLRAANTGVSAIISPHGKITATTPWWTQGVVIGTYHLSDVITPYQRWGDWPLVILPIILLLIYIKPASRKHR